MENLFGKLLRMHIEKAGIKESELADKLSYDTTYISKWINGSKLPSQRNAERIIGQMADYFAELAEGENQGKTETEQRRRIFQELKNAYLCDSSYGAFQSYNNRQMSFLNNKQTLMELTKDALNQVLSTGSGFVSICATLDLFLLYDDALKRLIRRLHALGVKKVELKMAIDPDSLNEKWELYGAGILGIIGSLDYIELTIVCKRPGQPEIITINDLLCMQVLWHTPWDFAAVFSMESHIVSEFSAMCRQIFGTSEKLLDPAAPESLRRTNVQLDSYAGKQQRLFFNEPPAMLFPPQIMEQFIRDAKEEEYASYLAKLKNIFEQRTCKSKVDLVLYSSMINRYLSDGCVSVGNVRQQLTEEQTKQHLAYLAEVMKMNPEFSLYLIRDTFVLDEELQRAPSLFIDSYGLYIENSQKGSNDNFHISMEDRLCDVFKRFFDQILTRSYCTKLTPEDLLRYL